MDLNPSCMIGPESVPVCQMNYEKVKTTASSTDWSGTGREGLSCNG